MKSKIRVKNCQELKRKILKGGYSERGFSSVIGRSSVYITQILNGDRNPNPATVKIICGKLNIEFDDFFYIDSACKSNQ